MRIVAKRGKSTYLVDAGDGKGQVYDESTRTLHPPFNIQSILARGYWEPFEGELAKPIEKHQGPGPHKSGSEQGVHAGTGRYLANRTMSDAPGEGGFTFRFIGKTRVPSGGKVVSPYPRDSEVILERTFAMHGRELIADFRKKNAARLKKPGHYLGGWRDKETGQVYLDVSIVAATHDDARRLARTHKQLAYWDLDADREVRYDSDTDSWND